MTALLFLSAGAIGIVVPGIPGWALVRIAITILSKDVRGLSLLDQWLTKRFPSASGVALGFAFKLFMDIKNRFPADPGVAGVA
ncbi:MAG: hypothetical protein ACREXY_20205 [Gammaproteobacteria bacterium]